ncbi:TIGR04211 family SH3 domain-containing protein [Pokkaliibacter sp. CJK22405]|uniref:TIGR04211 family SH3 domain-containing protein n=1 Tax=Pokkaliibacter sp. CJK22405 TaxID=3384615 RepID=UPI0039846B93
MVKARVCLLTGLLLGAAPLYAATAYISDVQFVAVRATASNSSAVVERGLKSGERVDVLDKGDEFTKIRTGSGNEGWVPNYFLMDDRASRDQIEALKSKVENLQTERDSLQSTLDSIQQQRDQLKTNLDETESKRSSLSKQLGSLDAQMREVAQWKSEKQSLTDQVSQLQQQLTSTQSDNQQLRANQKSSWFIAGGGVAGAGIMVGIIFSSMLRGRKKKSDWV